MTTVGALAVFGGATAAHAAPGDSANASATFLGGSVAGTPLSDIIDVAGASASNDGEGPAVTDFNDLDVSVLGGVLTIGAGGGIQIPIDGVDAGVVGQYASAGSDGTSIAVAGAVNDEGTVGAGPVPADPPGSLTLDLTEAVDSLAGPLPAALVDELAAVNLTLGAATAQASLTGADGVARSYTIAGGQLVIASDTVDEVSDILDAAVTGLDTLETDLNGAVAGVFSLLGGLVDAGLEVDTSSVTGALNALNTTPLTDPAYPGVSIDLGDGTIVVDLDAVQPLNGRGDSAEIFDTETINAISDAVVGLLGGLTDSIDTTIIPGIEGIAVTGGVAVDDVPLVGDVEVLTVDTTVGALRDDVTTGITVADIPPLPLPGAGAVLAALLGPIDGLIDPLLAVVDGLADDVLATLAPALDGVLPLLVSLTVNNQTEPAAGVYSETAAILTVLPTLGIDALVLEIANATVGPNVVDANIDVAITSPTAGQVFPVPDADDTTPVTVTGIGQPGADITVIVNGETQTVPVDGPGGSWSATFADLPVGPYTATAEQDVDGTEAAVAFSVAAAPDVVILDPTDGEDFSVDGPADTFDVPVTGTGFAGSVIDVVVGATTETTTVATDGTWGVVFDDLPVGDYTATATQVFDGSTDLVEFSVVEAADVVIEVPADGDEIIVDGPADLADVVVRGSGAPNATVTVDIPGVGTLSDVVDGVTGDWSVEFLDLPVGDYTATATQDVDDSVDTVTFDVIAAEDVSITDPADDEQIFVDGPTDVTTVEVAGTGQEGETVTVTIPGQPTPAAATVDADGEWSVEFPGLPVATYTATATQSDGSTDTVTFAVVAEADVTITSPTPGQQLTVASPTGTLDVPVTGTGQDGAIISVTVGTTTQDAVVIGGTWTTTFQDLPAGDYTATAVQNLDGSTAEVDFDIVAIDDVEILVPANNAEILVDTPTSTTTVTVSGTGFEGATVNVSIPGQPTLSDVVTGGAWSVEFPGLGTGGYTAAAVQAADGSTDSTTFTIAAADDVLITSPQEGERLLVDEPGQVRDVLVTGTGEIGLEVDVTIPGLGTETATVSSLGGIWAVTFDDVGEGDYTATAVQEDGSTDSVSFEVAAAVDVEIGVPADDEVFPVPGLTDTEDVTVSGTGEPTLEIEVAVGAEVLDTVVLPDGTWSVTFQDLPVGEYTAVAEQEDGSTDEVDFEIEAIADVEIVVPDADEVFWVDAPTDTTSVVVSGTGYTGETVTVTSPGLPTQTSPVVDGDWSVTFPNVPVGEYTATAQQSGDASSDTVDFSVDDLADVEILEPGTGDVIVVPDTGDTVPVQVCGTGQPGSDITVTIGGLPPVIVEVLPDGTWCVTEPNVPEGEHEVVAEQPDDGSETTIVIVVEAADDVTIETPTDGQEIPATAPIPAVDVPVTGTGEPGLDVVVVLDGDEEIETVVGEDGTWEVIFEDVPAGDHEVTATQPFDDSTETRDFTVIDVVVPVDITSPADGTQLTVPDEGDVLAVVVSGTGEPDAEVEVVLEGVTGTETATVGDDGTWTVTFDGVGVGSYTATATQDVDGTTDTTTVSIVVAPIDTSKARADVTQQRIVRGPNATQTVVVTGFQPGETVSGTVNSTPFELVPVIADATGNARVTFAVGTDFPLGQHRVEVRGSLTGELPADRENTVFLVVAPVAAGGALPATGYDGLGGVLLGGTGFSLLLAGAAMWMLRRRVTAE